MQKRKFIVRVIQAIAALLSPTVVRAGNSKEGETNRVKMLTRDGKLVWVDLKQPQKSKQEAPLTNQQLLSWIKPNHNESK